MMDTNHVFRQMAELQALEEGVTYEEIVAAEVGTDLGQVLMHYDIRTAWREYRANLRWARKNRRIADEFANTSPPPF